MRAMSAAHACAFSLLARCQPITCFSVQAIIITTSRPKPKAIHLHHVVDLVTDRSHGPQVPELIREMPEGASGHAELALGLFCESSHLRNSSSSLGSLS